MTWLPDHRADHAPEAECEGCRTPDSRSVVEALRSEPRAAAVRPDLVIPPGTNRN